MIKQRIRKWLVPLACLAVLLLGTVLMDVLRSETDVDVYISSNGIYAEVNGAQVAIPKEVLAKHPDSTRFRMVRTYVPPPGWPAGEPSTSIYWQPAQDGPFRFIGKAGEWLQSLRLPSRWVGHWPSTPRQPFDRFALLGGRTSATIDLLQRPSETPVFKLVIHPEDRTLRWFDVTGSGQEEQVASGFYRPRGRASVEDFAVELVWASMAGSVLCLLAWLVGFVVSLRVRQLAKEATYPSGTEKSRWATLDKPYVPAIALFLAATILASAASLWVLDAIPHVQDEVGYLFQGKIFALGRSYAPTPPGPEFFANGFIQMFEGKWFAKYPPGFPLLLVPGVWAGLPWLIDPLCAGVSLALIYAAGLKMYGRRVATWGALLGLVSPWVIFMSGSYMSHPSTMMWTAVFLYALVCTKTSGIGRQGLEVSREPRRFRLRIPAVLWPLLAGFALGMAFITRQWTAAGIGVGAAIWVLGDIGLAHGTERAPKFARYLLILVGVVPPMLVILYENHQLTGDWLRFTQDLVGSYDQPGFGPGHGDAIGHTPALGVYNALVYWRSLGSMFDGWPVPFALAPLLLGTIAWVGERDRRRLGWDALLWLGTLGLVGAYFVWWSDTTIFGPRYWYEAMPFLLLMAGRGLDLIGRVAASVVAGTAFASRLRWAIPASIFVVGTVYTLTQSIPYWEDSYTDYNGISAEPLQAAESANLKNALIFVQLDPSKPNRDYGKVFPANDPLLRGDRIYVRDLGAARNKGLLGYFPGRQPYYLPLEGPPRPGVGP